MVAPLIVVALLSIAMAGFGLYEATTQSDSLSVERQVRTTRQAFDLSIADLAKEQEIIAVWDDPILKLREKSPDWQWLDDNIGVWLHDMFGHDHVYLLDARDRAVYAMVDGERARTSAYGAVAADVAPLLHAVRTRLRNPARVTDPRPHAAAARHHTHLTIQQAVYDSDLASVRGRPAAVSVMQFKSLTDGVAVAPGQEHVVVSVRFLDGPFLNGLSGRNLIAGLRYSRSADSRRGEQALPLTADDGRRVGYLLWKPELPGTALIRALAPITALVLGLVIALLVLLARWLHRSTRELHTTLVELQASEAQAQHLAFHDVLTGLPNRALFNDRLDQALARARRGGTMALLALDLDRFKHVNDTLGHHAGDALIREFAGRLLAVVRENDTVARLGGDEFGILLEGGTTEDEVAAICSRILESVRQPFELVGSNVFVGVSIGVVHAPSAGHERVDLLRKADIALYSAKDQGRDCFRVFTADLDETVRQRRTIEEELRAALAEGGGLQVHYQPQVAGPSGSIVGLEALLRWHHPERGLISPEQFVPIAEETGLICPLGEWVLQQACEVACRFPDLFMAVNLSPVQFRSAGFPERVIRIVRESGAAPSSIELEVTETVLVDDDELVRSALGKLRNAGLRIALDDFGTGYSSLSYLRRFEVDKIKIDRSFVQHLGHAVDSAAIVTAVVTLGHAMGLSVTAEGVETDDQQQFLTAAGCNHLQGFLYSRAVPEAELPALLMAHSPRQVA